MQLQREIERMVHAECERQAAAIERACEMSLVDPHGRGVLVDGQGVPALSTDVPYGEVHYMPRVFPSVLDLR